MKTPENKSNERERTRQITSLIKEKYILICVSVASGHKNPSYDFLLYHRRVSVFSLYPICA